MATKNLIINNELGSFIFNEASLNALEEFLVFGMPFVDDALEYPSVDECDSLEKSYRNHLYNDVRPLVRNIYNILHYSGKLHGSKSL